MKVRPGEGLLFVAPLDAGYRGSILLSVDVARCFRVVAVGRGDRRRHRPVVQAGSADRSQWAWRSKDVALAAASGVSIGDVIVVDPHAPRLGRVQLGAEVCDVIHSRDAEAVIDRYEPGRVA